MMRIDMDYTGLRRLRVLLMPIGRFRGSGVEQRLLLRAAWELCGTIVAALEWIRRALFDRAGWNLVADLPRGRGCR